MDFLSLKIFLAISHTQKISSAAISLYLSQPTVSRKLAQLEQELGTQLFFRSKGHERVFLTTQGEKFVSIANSILELYDQAMNLRQIPQQFRLRVSTVNSVGAYALAPFFLELLTEYSTTQLTVSHQHSAEICELIENRSFDIGIAHMEAPYSDLNSELLFQEDYCVIHRGPLENVASLLHPSELDPAHQLYEHFSAELDYWLDAWWPSSQAKVRLNNTAQLVSCFRHPLDWCILPYSVALALKKDGFHISPLSVTPPKRQVWLITRRNTQYYNYPAVEDFCQRIRMYISNTLLPELQSAPLSI